MANRFVRLFARLQRYAGHPWYAPLVATSATLDYFILASPAQSLFITTVLLNPVRRLYAALWFGIGAALGALLLAASVLLVDASLDAFLSGAQESSAYWQQVRGWLDQWGLLALVVLSIIPLPLRSVVILSALAGITAPVIGLLVFCGRFASFALIGQVVYQTPRFLMRIRWFRVFIERIRYQHRSTVDPINPSSAPCD